jgi:hypothetical protein
MHTATAAVWGERRFDERPSHTEVALMRSTIVRCLAGILVSTAAIFLTACDTVQDMAVLGVALHDRYDTPINLSVSEGKLRLTLPNASAADLPPVERRAFAHDLARFAHAHYGHPERISHITIVFEHVGGAAGMKLREEQGRYEWAMSDLTGQRDSVVAPRT